ncbi:MAG: tetratricopeptide repeat protein [Bradymonadales bacterium]|nr:tetratricopeptide repeat protein [Bradymonadales bacterium]
MKRYRCARTGRGIQAILVLAVFGVLAMVPALAGAQPAWDANRGNCEEVLVHPETFRLDQVRRCAQLWEAYREVGELTQSQVQQVARGFSRLFYEGDAADRAMAQTALNRMNTSVLERGDFLPRGSTSASAASRSPIRVGESSRSARRRAETFNRDGMRDYERGRYRDAARNFERALEADPWYPRAKYNLACQLALLGETAESLRHLDELSRWDTDEAHQQASRALVDEDFISLRDNPQFRDITGYTRVQLLNGADEAGLERTEEIHTALVDARMDVASYGYDRTARYRPIVWYRPGYERKAEQIRELLADPATGIRMINWDTQYDLIVVWGQSDEAAGAVSPPVVQGTFDGTILETGAEETAEEVQDSVDAARGFVEEWMPGD